MSNKVNDNKLKPDEIRKIIWGLSNRRAKLQKKLSYPSPMIEGCLHTVYKKCGNPACKCAKGKKHGPYWVLSRKNLSGKTKITYVDSIDIIDKAKAYKKYNKNLATLRKKNEKIFYWLRMLRDRYTTVYEK